MQRRTVLQIIAAFFASFADWFGFRRERPFELVRRKGPRGVVSPKARWFSPDSYEPVQTVSEQYLARISEAVRLGEKAFPPTTLRKGVPYVFRALPEAPEPQEGVVVMHLRNPACVTRHVLGVSGPMSPESYVTPTHPVAQAANRHWQPLEQFQPTSNHGALTPAGVVVGFMRNPALSARTDISNDLEYRTIVGRFPQSELLQIDRFLGSPEPTAEELQERAERKALMDANYDELLANWDSQVFDPADVERAQTRAAPAFEAFTYRKSEDLT